MSAHLLFARGDGRPASTEAFATEHQRSYGTIAALEFSAAGRAGFAFQIPNLQSEGAGESKTFNDSGILRTCISSRALLTTYDGSDRFHEASDAPSWAPGGHHSGDCCSRQQRPLPRHITSLRRPVQKVARTARCLATYWDCDAIRGKDSPRRSRFGSQLDAVRASKRRTEGLADPESTTVRTLLATAR